MKLTPPPLPFLSLVPLVKDVIYKNKKKVWEYVDVHT